MSSLGMRAANAQVISFVVVAPADPDKCSTNIKGRALVRLSSGLAFLFQRGSFELRDVVPTSSGKTTACPGDTLVTMAIESPMGSPARSEATRVPPLSSLTGISISGTDRSTYWQDLMIGWMEESRKRGDVCRVTDEGIEICYDSCKSVLDHPERCDDEGAEIRLKSRNESTGVALPGRYVEFNGRPFTYRCFPPALWTAEPTQSAQQCKVAYQITKGLSVTYSFDAAIVSQDHILDFDRQIRAQIMAARAPEYDVKP